MLPNKNEIREQIRNRVLSRVDLSREVEDEEIRDLIEEEILLISKETFLPLPERLGIQKDIFNSLRKLDILEDLLGEEGITEIMINGPNNIFIEKEGRIIKSEKSFASEEKLSDVIQQIVSTNNRVVNESTPIVDTRLPDGSRVNIILPPVAVDHSILAIRRFPKEPITMDKLLGYGSLSPEIVEFLKKLVKARYNIFVSGGTGSGKTSFINALTEFIPSDERVITIEDSAELQIQNVPNLVRLESRSANLEGKLAVPIRELVRAALRQRPDRIVVGECRGEEALEVLQACNTGHDGSLSTGHANSARDMLSRLETMVLMGMDLPIPAIRQQIASGIDILVHLGRLKDKSRKLIEISEVVGMRYKEIQLSTIYELDTETKGPPVWKKRNDLIHQEKLIQAGLLD